MKKKIWFYLVTGAMVLAFAGCGNAEVSQDTSLDSSQTVQEERVESSESTAVEEVSSEESATEESTTVEESENRASEEISVQDTEETVAEKEESEDEEVTKQEENNFDVPLNFTSIQKGAKYGKMQEITYESKTTGTTRKANIILPVDYSEDKEYPVLYLLHGIGGDQNEWKGGKPEYIVSNLVAAGETSEMIVVFPNVRARANDAGNPGDIYTVEHFNAFDNFINDLRDDLMPFIEENYSIATGKENTAIAGLSMGGREALYIGFSMPETFGYIGAFCPAPGVLPYHTEKGLFLEEDFRLPEGSDNMVMIVKGKTDGVVAEWPETYHKTLEANEVEHIYYETDGGHDFTVWKHGLYNFVKRIF